MNAEQPANLAYYVPPKSPRLCQWLAVATKVTPTPLTEVVAAATIKAFVLELNAMEAVVKIQTRQSTDSPLRIALKRLCDKLEVKCE